MATNDRRISSNTYQDLAHIVKALQSFSIESEQHAPIIPQTTRGIGLAVAQTYQYVSLLPTKVTLDVNVMYRTALAQHYVQMQHASIHQRGNKFRPTVPVQDFSSEPFLGFSTVMAQNTKNFSTVVAAISVFGDISFTDASMHGVIPRSSIKEESAMETTSDSEPLAKVAKTSRWIQSDPFVLTFDNLRNQLSPLTPNGAASLEMRKYFWKWNPVPGAQFDANYYLLNLDAIIPATYGQSQLLLDFAKFQLWMDSMTKYSYLFGELFFTGKGQLGAIVNCHSPLFIDKGVIESSGGDEFYAAPRKIGVQQLTFGVVGLVGEQPAPASFVYASKAYGCRHLVFAAESISIGWEQLMFGLLKRTN